MKFIKRHIIKIVIFVIIIILISVVRIKNDLNYSSDNKEIFDNDIENLEVDTEEDEIIKVSVDIKGAVNKPGVYEIDNNKKVIDVVNMASGFKDDADTSLINLAKKVVDEMVIIIYTKDQVKEAIKNDTISSKIDNVCICPKVTNDACLNKDTNSSDDSTSSNKSNSSSNNEKVSEEKVNINTASLEELQTLSGIGESKAQAIIDYRNKNGNFSKIEDILYVSGIGEALYEKIKEYITV